MRWLNSIEVVNHHNMPLVGMVKELYILIHIIKCQYTENWNFCLVLVCWADIWNADREMGSVNHLGKFGSVYEQWLFSIPTVRFVELNIFSLHQRHRGQGWHLLTWMYFELECLHYMEMIWSTWNYHCILFHLLIVKFKHCPLS